MIKALEVLVFERSMRKRQPLQEASGMSVFSINISKAEDVKKSIYMIYRLHVNFEIRTWRRDVLLAWKKILEI